jgi:hypothetical protein
MSNSSMPSYPTDQQVNESSWSVIWFNALRRPYLSTFEGFVRDPYASGKRAYMWVFVSSVLTALLVTFNPYRNNPLPPKTPLGILAYSVLGIVVFLLWTGFSQFVSRALNGKGTYTELAYTVACFQAPLTIIRAAFISSPIIQGILLVYGLYLTALATKAVHKFSWGKTVIVTVLVYIVACLLVLLMAIIYIVLMRTNRFVPVRLFG